VAYDACAVPETLSKSGVLLKDKRDPWLVAELIQTILQDERLRAGVIEGQKARLARYRNRDLEAELIELLGDLPH
jgi:glycosyltransferase involved in cell wall biosynthesis